MVGKFLIFMVEEVCVMQDEEDVLVSDSDMGVASLDFQPGYVSMPQAVLVTVTADGFALLV